MKGESGVLVNPQLEGDRNYAPMARWQLCLLLIGCFYKGESHYTSDANPFLTVLHQFYGEFWDSSQSQQVLAEEHLLDMYTEILVKTKASEHGVNVSMVGSYTLNFISHQI